MGDYVDYTPVRVDAGADQRAMVGSRRGEAAQLRGVADAPLREAQRMQAARRAPVLGQRLGRRHEQAEDDLSSLVAHQARLVGGGE
jgi:hypothetical protein